MTLWLQVVLSVLYSLCLLAIVFLLVWTAVLSARRYDRAQEALIDAVARAQENNRLSSEAAQGLARLIVDLHEEKQAAIDARDIAEDAGSGGG